jgi:poly-gamma-glutamate synthesis protein (capsule biosynthesis protein)
VTIIAGGDVMLDRGVARQIRKHGAPWIFSGIATHLRRADIAFANLESPLCHAPKVARAPAFRADPNLAPALKTAGFDVMSVANNHALDCGALGFSQTFQALKSARIQPVGAASSTWVPIQPIVMSARGVRIAWLAATEFGAPPIAILSEAWLRSQISAARGRADVVIVSAHWGVEYQISPTATQRKWARAALEAGADVLLGHHSHVLGPVEETKLHGRKRLVAYSLGNLIFDAPRWNRRANQSALLRLCVTKRGLSTWEMVPLKIENSRPQVLQLLQRGTTGTTGTTGTAG